MKSYSRLLFRIGYIALGLWLLTTGCLPFASSTETPESVATQLALSPQSATATQVLPKPSPTSTSTLFVTLTPRPATVTPQPTLSVAEAKALVLELLQNNAQCQLPCLWGLTPGEPEARALASALGRIGTTATANSDTVLHVVRAKEGIGILANFVEGGLDFNIDFGRTTAQGKLQFLALSAGVTDDATQTQVFGNARFKEMLQDYLLPQILSTYGKPTQVLLAPFYPEVDYLKPLWIPFSLVVYYPEKGILVQYIMPRESQNEQFVGCPLQSYIDVMVWDPQVGYSLTDVASKMSGQGINALNVDYFKPVDKATSLKLDEFYQTFKNPDNITCLKTPMTLWPKP